MCSHSQGKLNGLVHGRGGDIKRIIQIMYDHDQTYNNEPYVEPPCVCQAHPEVIDQIVTEIRGLWVASETELF